MRYDLNSEIHPKPPALEAVLADFEGRNGRVSRVRKNAGMEATPTWTAASYLRRSPCRYSRDPVRAFGRPSIGRLRVSVRFEEARG